mmetsp:Transcript_72706/g.128454  ORF Transcript_72706/g.128454 Transcript_72706/m.128454 type:complete len:265 (+) Transcript_72706:1058-1852(+)
MQAKRSEVFHIQGGMSSPIQCVEDLLLIGFGNLCQPLLKWIAIAQCTLLWECSFHCSCTLEELLELSKGDMRDIVHGCHLLEAAVEVTEAYQQRASKFCKNLWWQSRLASLLEQLELLQIDLTIFVSVNEAEVRENVVQLQPTTLQLEHKGAEGDSLLPGVDPIKHRRAWIEKTSNLLLSIHINVTWEWISLLVEACVGALLEHELQRKLDAAELVLLEPGAMSFSLPVAMRTSFARVQDQEVLLHVPSRRSHHAAVGVDNFQR